MSLTLHVDGERWRGHLRDYAAAHPYLVPVAKGNGYGFTNARLARRAQWLADQQLPDCPLDVLAVGTYDELGQVAQRYDGSLLVLTPWRPGCRIGEETPAARVIHTVSRAEDLPRLTSEQPAARFVLERATSMVRHGMGARELREASAYLHERGLSDRLAGIALHLPLSQISHTAEVARLMNDVVAADLPTRTVWVSHLDDGELADLRAKWPEYTIRPRVGTALWLGDRSMLRVTATVLDAHPVQRGDVFGYRGRSAPRNGTLLVVSGGTAHGIGLEAPSGALDLRNRAASIARGGLDAAGLVRSPFSIAGKQRLFAEPPHMQASMLFLPADAEVPAVGDEVDVRVRYTATSFDRTALE